MNSIVTGGCGFIGSHIVDKLVTLGHSVKVIDDLSAPENSEFYYHEDREKVRYFHDDITKDECGKLFKDVDYVFHLAARSRIQPTIKNPGSCFEVNVVGTQRVLEWSRMHFVKKVIYSGTSSLYGHQNQTPFNPNMPPDCLNPYSMSKWMGEQVCKLYYQLYDMPSIVLRYFNVYGPREPTHGCYAPVLGLFKRQADAGMPLTIVGKGTQKRDFTYVDDVIEANILAAFSDINFGIYNIGTGVSHTINEVANMISDNVVYTAKRPAEVNETLADISLTIKDLKWHPENKLKDKILSY